MTKYLPQICFGNGLGLGVILKRIIVFCSVLGKLHMAHSLIIFWISIWLFGNKWFYFKNVVIFDWRI